MNLQIAQHIKRLQSYESPSVINPYQCNASLEMTWNLFGISPLVQEQLFNFKSYHVYTYENEKKTIDAVADYLNVNQNNIILSHGSLEGLNLVLNAMLEPGDQIPYFHPSFEVYRMLCSKYGTYCYDVDYIISKTKIDFPYYRLESILNDEPKLVIICSPNNPTGTSVDKERILNLADLHKKTLFIIDEAYSEFSGISFVEEAAIRENIVVLRTFSKGFSLAGARIGAVIANPEFTQILNNIRIPIGMNHMSMLLLQAAIKDIDFYKKQIEQINREKALFVNELQELGLFTYQSDANFILVHLGDLYNDIMKALIKNKIYIRGKDHLPILKQCVRITIAPRHIMELILSIIKDVI